MDALVDVILILLSACGLVTSVYYGVVLFRAMRAARALPTARTGLSLPEPEGGWPGLCIVIPAHNEQDVIAGLARSLVAQEYPDLCIVFALDRCTDETEPLLRKAIEGADGKPDARVEIITIDHCPDDWAGKVNAVHLGVTRSNGAKDAKVLLFTDADTIFDPSLCRATVALLHARDLGLLSLLSRLTIEHWYERLVQPAVAFELIRQYPLDNINRARKPRAFANGQFMLFRRDLYDAIGGHELVHDRLLEDIAFAREINRRKDTLAHGRWGVFMSAGMLQCRMYRSWEDFQRGWKRIFTEAAGQRPSHLRKWSIRQRLTGTLLPIMSVLAVVVGFAMLASHMKPDLARSAGLFGLAGSIISTLALAHIYRSQGVRVIWALTYPIGAWMSAKIQGQAGTDLRSGEKTVWAGREYAREVRG